MVVSYIYFTRIIIYLLDATLPFRLVWLGALFTEIATLLFFGVTGFKFRPAADNPYFELADDERAKAVGFDLDEYEPTAATGPRKKAPRDEGVEV